MLDCRQTKGTNDLINNELPGSGAAYHVLPNVSVPETNLFFLIGVKAC